MPSERRVAILGFHKIGAPGPDGWDTWYYVSADTFAAQLRELGARGWAVIDASRLLAGLESPATLPDRAAVLTFDDGYRSMREVALPVLQQFGYPAVLFVPTDYIGGRNVFDADSEPDEAICDWDDLRALEQGGVSIQSHGASHRPFSALDAGEQELELRRSRVALEAGLGRTVELFAYPYGDSGTDPEVAAGALARTGYRAACVYGGGPQPWPATAPYRLTRLAIGPDTDLAAALGGAEA